MQDDKDSVATAPGIGIDLISAADGSAFAEWKSRLALLFDISLPDPACEADFKVSGRNWQLPSAIVTNVQRSGVVLRRTAEFIDANPVDHVCLYFARGGTMHVDCDGNAFDAQAGDVFLMDYRRPVTTLARDPYANATVMFTRAAGPAAFRDGALHGARLRADEPAARLLHGQLQGLLRELDVLPVREADAAMQGLLTLASVMLGGRSAAGVSAGHALTDRAAAAIRGRLADPDLTPDTIASELSISRAKLYRLLAPYGGVRALMNRVRLDESLKMLASLPLDAVSVSDIASRHGFKSAAQFSRAFRARFGRSPSDLVALRKRHPTAEFYRAWIATRRAQSDYETIDAWLDAIVTAAVRN